MHKQLAVNGHVKDNYHKTNDKTLKKHTLRYRNNKEKWRELYQYVKEPNRKAKKSHTLLKIYSNKETVFNAKINNMNIRQNKMNQTKKSILSLLDRNFENILKPHKLTVSGDGEISLRRQVTKGYLRAFISQSENDILKNNSHSCINLSQIRNTSINYYSLRQLNHITNRSVVPCKSMLKSLKSDAYEKKKEEMNNIDFHLKKKNNEMQQIFQQKLNLYGLVEGY